MNSNSVGVLGCNMINQRFCFGHGILMNKAAYRDCDTKKIGERVEIYKHGQGQNGLSFSHFYLDDKSQQGLHYIAIAGVASKYDSMDTLRSFLGIPPTHRIQAVVHYIEKNLGGLDPTRIGLGGHSMGGLVADYVADYIKPGIVFTQNAPASLNKPLYSKTIELISVADGSRSMRADTIGSWGRNGNNTWHVPVDGSLHGIDPMIRAIEKTEAFNTLTADVLCRQNNQQIVDAPGFIAAFARSARNLLGQRDKAMLAQAIPVKPAKPD